ncbi:hypothetical protein G3T14_17500 [Methylobacterium sp. BTF04]|uniref:hypothetical protein n=1 Tax=Methylobacterium sp. BTF04 TaxID=2708300 RepID=UPI0013D69C06|nr:hypothetical protein [Methylobacterium sp. BTF04]
MSFTVRARVSARQFSFHHGSMLGALDQSLSLLTAGMSDVQIVDANGRSHSPASLHQLLFGARVVVAAPAVETLETVKLAA